MPMKAVVRGAGILLLPMLAAAALSAAAHADTWSAIEPYNSTIPGLDYYDGSPNGYGYPCEIYGMTVWSDSGGKFGFEIATNFGDLATRQAFDNAHPSWRWRDSYTRSTRLRNFAVGDLYIRKRSITGSPDEVYGLVLESRQGTTGDPCYCTLANAGYSSYAAKNQGELYRWSDGQLGFATGSYEAYAGNFDELPDMNLARQLPALADSTTARLRNAYPTVMLDGDLVNTSGTWAGWRSTTGTTYAGVWEGEFALPDFDPASDYLEVWWAMGCGNDGVRVVTQAAGGEPVPAPASFLLVCFGGLCTAAWSRLRRRK